MNGFKQSAAMEDSKSGQQKTSRALIACRNCRNSKIRCNNEDPGAPCRACNKKGKVCDYGSTEATVKRRESAIDNVDTLSEKQALQLEKLKDQEDPLRAPFLTPKVWGELFEIYEKHFASDFPFLHRRRFLEPLHQSNEFAAPRLDSGRLPCPRHPPYLLLGFLALTARYHPEIVSRLGLDKVATADYYANATEIRLGSLPGQGSLEKAQAMLFLGFHRWSALKGGNGWYIIAIATRYVQNLGYHKLDGGSNDRDGMNRTTIDLPQMQDAIGLEIRRRTFWSCFILDRYTGCAENRDYMINVDDIATQLPCSDEAFNKGLKVQTRFLGEGDNTDRERRLTDELRNSNNRIWDSGSNGNEEIKQQEGMDEATLSLYIQTVNFFGLVWSFRKERRQERQPPWDEDSKFRKLELGHQELKARLPDHLTLTQLHTEDIIYDRANNLRDYILIHALHSLITIALYREYMAFAPWRANMEPKIGKFPPTKDYWVNQARLCCDAARAFADLLRAYRRAGVLVHSIIAGWATYIIGWCAMYFHMFPNTDLALESRAQITAWNLANEILLEMGDQFVMPRQSLDYLVETYEYYRSKQATRGTSNDSSREDSGEGLKKYKSQGFESDDVELDTHFDMYWNEPEERKNQRKNQHSLLRTNKRASYGFTAVNQTS
ncbi:hypothetical protein HBH98_161960 [Parastagonospora nodorum]|nr:hypothetical protein HBH53_258800 [Parastagonospora nodorum]KAH3956084.1 hypothetical protein HBH51_256020 [Parastagonospora nodorum]KAH4215335.1 hypothetical protein HBI06_256160 [Parastagonospora nodorum]KAH4223043.1 hypothetical protein HBI05_251960 [Parastagonospora nodorum]KAH4342743.1 hypothetical protein HBH98_161960 [Parastagonospora nodorum]